MFGLGDGKSDLHMHDWRVNTIEGPTNLVHQDRILGGLSIGKLAPKLVQMPIAHIGPQAYFGASDGHPHP